MSYRRTRRILASASFTVLFQMLTVTGNCQNLAIRFSETASKVFNPPNLTRGYVIDVNQAFDISALGAFDSTGDGLATSHIVTIWDSSGKVMASANLPAGTGGELIGQFRYEAITPVALNPGSYTVGVFYPTIMHPGHGDAMPTGVANLTTDPELSVVSFESVHPGYYAPGGLLASRETYCGNIIITPVPEPSTLTLMGTGAVGVMARGIILGCKSLKLNLVADLLPRCSRLSC